MSFYGKVVNLDRAQFNFDKIYSSRYEMDHNIKTDGIYVNRLVLVEYDSEGSDDSFKSCYLAPDGKLYASFKQKEGTSIQEVLDGAVEFPAAYKLEVVPSSTVSLNYCQVRQGDVVRVPATVIDKNGKITERFNYNTLASSHEPIDIGTLNGSVTLYYQAKLVNGQSEFTILTSANSAYVRNYALDTSIYGKGRGWDSTVWQKVYKDNKEQYIMIAELNSTMPALGISTDAPSIVPTAPHFDTDSTNKFYQLHWQPSWGLRVKGAEQFTGPVLDENGNKSELFTNSTILTNDVKDYPSDEETSWFQIKMDTENNTSQKQYFNAETKQWQNAESKIPAAIYYNKAGFNPEHISYADENITDKISIEPTGYSGHLYNQHDGTNRLAVSEDTQEISIMLPSLGNTLAHIWDLVYGSEEQNGSLNRNLNINWDNKDGLRLVNINSEGNGYTYDTDKVNTLAGCINSVHDLMGMIIVTNNDNHVDLQDFNNIDLDKIYYQNQKYYRIRNTDLVKRYKEGLLTTVASIDGKYVFKPGRNYYIVYLEDGSNAQFDKDQATYINQHFKVGQKWNTEITDVIDGIVLAPDIIDVKISDQTSLSYIFKPDKKYYIVDAGTSGLNVGTAWSISDTKVRQGIQLASSVAEVVQVSRYDMAVGTQYQISALEDIDELLEKYVIGDVWTEGDRVVPGVTLSQYVATTDQKLYYNMQDGVDYYIAKEIGSGTSLTEEKIQELQEKYGSIYENHEVWPYGREFIDGIVLGYYEEDQTELTLIGSIYEREWVFRDGVIYQITQVENSAGMSAEEFENFKEQYQVGQIWDTANKTYIEGLTLATPPIAALDRDEYVLEEGINYQIVGYDLTDLSIDEQTALKTNYPLGQAWTSIVAIKGLLVGENRADTKEKYYYEFIDDVNYYIEAIDGSKEYDYDYTIGQKWDTDYRVVVDGLSLIGQQMGYEFSELVGFADGLNTIHGLILKLNALLEIDNETSRDNKTVQGCINLMNDILNTFDTLTPKSLLTVDQFGKIISAKINTDQTNSINFTKEPPKTNGIILTNLLPDPSLENSFWGDFTLSPYVVFDGRTSVEIEPMSEGFDIGGLESGKSIDIPKTINHVFYIACHTEWGVSDIGFFFDKEGGLHSPLLDIAKNYEIRTPWYRHSGRQKMLVTQGAIYPLFKLYFEKTDSERYVDGLMLIDLTEAFGEGKEPTREWCDANIPFFKNTYCFSKDSDDIINKDIYKYEHSDPAMINKQWITVNINNDKNNNILSIHHNYHRLEDIKPSLENNPNAYDLYNMTYTDDKYNGSILLRDYLIDETGHVVGKQNKIAPLSTHFKDIVINNLNYQPYFSRMLELSYQGAIFNLDNPKVIENKDALLAAWLEEKNSGNLTDTEYNLYLRWIAEFENSVTARGNSNPYETSHPRDIFTAIPEDSTIYSAPITAEVPVRGSMASGGLLKTTSTQKPLEITSVNKWIQLRGVFVPVGGKREPHYYNELLSFGATFTEGTLELTNAAELTAKANALADPEKTMWLSRIQEYQSDWTLPRTVNDQLQVAHKISVVDTSDKPNTEEPVLYDIEYDEAGHIIGKHKYTKGISADVGSSTVKGYINETTDSIIEPTGEATLNNYIKRLWNKINSLEQRIAALESKT